MYFEGHFQYNLHEQNNSVFTNYQNVWNTALHEKTLYNMNDNAKIDASDDKEANNSDDPPSHHHTQTQPNENP